MSCIETSCANAVHIAVHDRCGSEAQRAYVDREVFAGPVYDVSTVGCSTTENVCGSSLACASHDVRAEPQEMVAAIAHFLATHAIAMLMLAAGLETDRALVHDIAVRWRFLLRALAIVWIAVPLFALGVVYVVRPSPLGALVLVVLAICPGVPMARLQSKRSRGDERTTLLLLISTAILALVLVPVWISVLTQVAHYRLEIPTTEIVKLEASTVILPFLIGRFVVFIAPRVAAKLAKVCLALFFVGVAFILVVVIAKKLPTFRDLTARDVVAGLVIPAAAAVLGYVGVPAARERRISVAYASALGNPMLAVAILARNFEMKPLPVVLAFVLLRAFALFPFSRWLKSSHEPGTPAVARDDTLGRTYGAHTT